MFDGIIDQFVYRLLINYIFPVGIGYRRPTHTAIPQDGNRIVQSFKLTVSHLADRHFTGMMSGRVIFQCRFGAATHQGGSHGSSTGSHDTQETASAQALLFI